MLTHPILDQLLELKLTGMHRAMTEQMNMTDLDPLSFEERLGLLVDREMTERVVLHRKVIRVLHRKLTRLNQPDYDSRLC